MPAGKTCNPAHRPGKIPLRSVRGTRTERKRPVSSETHIDRKKPRNESQRHNLIKSKEMASIFSRIIAGEIPSYKVAEDENYYAFLDINPLTKGHTLVVPKQEVNYIFDLDDRTLAGMMVFAKQVAARIKREIACARVAVVVLGMEVPHAHIHLIPIQSENDVDFHREKLRLTPEEFREIAEKLAR
jgi:bis(5'-nucleosyl)-tetraphosphatase (symmetrical)